MLVSADGSSSAQQPVTQNQNANQPTSNPGSASSAARTPNSASSMSSTPISDPASTPAISSTNTGGQSSAGDFTTLDASYKRFALSQMLADRQAVPGVSLTPGTP